MAMETGRRARYRYSFDFNAFVAHKFLDIIRSR